MPIVLTVIAAIAVVIVFLIGKGFSIKMFGEADDLRVALEADLSEYTICIDPGHGGSQPGAVEGDVCESDLNLAVSLDLKNILEGAGATVVMTRETDTDVSLTERAQIANDAEADLFVSIHQNMLEDNTEPNGTETWIYSEDYYDAVRAAGFIQKNVTETTGANDRGLKASTELAVLAHTQMSACLVECGFMSNPAELENLTSDTYRTVLAYGIALGIAAWASEEEAPEYAVTIQG